MAQSEASRSTVEEVLLRDLRDFLHQQDLEPDNHLPPYQAGLIYARLGDYRSALQSYKVALDRRPGFQQAYFNMGTAFSALEQYGEAEEAYRQALRLDENDPESWANLGAVQEHLGRAEDALGSYRRAVALDGGESEARMRIGRIHMARGEFEEARRVYEEVTAGNGNALEGWNELGLAFSHLEQPEQAESCYRKVLALNEEFAKAWSNLGNLLLARGDEEGAQQAYLTAVEKDGGDPDLWFNLGEFFFQRNHRRTEECLLKVVDLDRTDYEAWSLLYQWYRRHPNDQRMLMVLRVLTLAHPDDPGMLREMARAHENLGQFPEAVEILGQLLAQEPKDEESNLTMTRLLLKDGRVSEAYRHMTQVSFTTPEVLDHWTHLGHRLLHHEQPEEAEQCFLRVLEHRPGVPELWRYCGEIALRRGELELALERFERVGVMNRNDRHAWMPLTRKFFGRGEYGKAAECLDHLRDLEPYLPDLWVEFFQVREKADQAGPFLSRLERILETEQAPNRHWDTLAELFESAGDPERAAACRERLDPAVSFRAEPREADSAGEPEAGTEEPEEEHAEPQYLEAQPPAPVLLMEGEEGGEPDHPEDFWIDQGEAHYRAGRVTDAVESLQKALDQDLPRYRAWFRMGGLFYMLGKLDEAETAFRSATERNPDEPKGWYNLGVCQAEQGKLGDARRSFRRVLGLNRRFAKAWDWLGLLQFNAGEFAPARRSFVRCLAVERESANAWHNLGMLYRTMGREEDSAHCLAQAERLGGVDEKEEIASLRFSFGAGTAAAPES